MNCPYCGKSQEGNDQLRIADINCENYGGHVYQIQCINPKCNQVFTLPASRTVAFGKPYKTDCNDPDFPQALRKIKCIKADQDVELRKEIRSWHDRIDLTPDSNTET